jgi:hypothetical protein
VSKYANKRMHVRGRGGQFKKATPKDFGFGDACPNCHSFMIRHYDGDPRDAFPHPNNFRFRCFTCEPKTEAELAVEAEIEASKPKQPSIIDLLMRGV